MSTVLRHVEYYKMQETFDWLYRRSQNNCMKGIDLYKIITSENNILLAYRTIKTNTGSKTAGTDGQTISDLRAMDKETLIPEIRQRLKMYRPQTIRKIEIPKPNGKIRPLGIPTMQDRLIQQMFKQVLEPIVEAKFFKHSYGFRPNRSTEHAIARCKHVVYQCNCHFAVDIDIEGFFDNVNHTKLMKQLYTIGVKDKRVLAIISKMLKAPIDAQGVPTKGTPQGGILSPLLANIVLNDLDWWVAKQWEEFETTFNYVHRKHRYRALRKTKLKEMHLIRYADDIKVFTTDPKTAIKIFHGMKGYIENQLKLPISKEKSQITNLRKRYTEFLGFEMKVEKQRKHQYATISRISVKSKRRLKRELRMRIRGIQKHPTPQQAMLYNSFVLGVQNYYCIATRVNLDFSDIYFSCLSAFIHRLRNLGNYEIPRSPPTSYKQRYKGKRKTIKIMGFHLFPIADISWKPPRYFNPKVNNYTEEGRKERIKRLPSTISNEITKLSLQMSRNYNVDYSDNRLSKYSMQRGMCQVTKQYLKAEDAHCHHILPKHLGGGDEFSNLVIIHTWVHQLIHATQPETINRYIQLLKLTTKEVKKVNQYREYCNLTDIT